MTKTRYDGPVRADRPATEKKVALAPDLRGLSERARRAWVEQMSVRPLGDQYVVESGGTYVVDPNRGTCTCPDHQIRGETCKHLRRVAIEITARRVPPPGERRAHCESCGIETFVPREAEQPVFCSTCRVEPGDVVFDRESGDRLVVVTVTNQRADDVEIPDAGTTVADYPTNQAYPDDDSVAEAIYAADVSRRDDPTRYSFPISRLQPTGEAALVE